MAIDGLLLSCGAAGALVTAYIGKGTIPEFPAFFDVAETTQQLMALRTRVKATNAHIDRVQQKLETDHLTPGVAEQLRVVVQSSLDELHTDGDAIKRHEQALQRTESISRVLGFVCYIGLGALFAVLLTGRVQITGLGVATSDYIEALIIGAGWITFLSTLGLRTRLEGADKALEAGLARTDEELARVRGEALKLVAQAVAQAKSEVPEIVLRHLSNEGDEQAEKIMATHADGSGFYYLLPSKGEPHTSMRTIAPTTTPSLQPDEVAAAITDRLDATSATVRNNLATTRQLVRRELSRIL